jgi:hypothetical protein
MRRAMFGLGPSQTWCNGSFCAAIASKADSAIGLGKFMSAVVD